ncbi:Glyoxalase/bleomycin resistance protein/dioxygenase [Hymenobacter roseosalivarius DSM 11622]|uniref:Glyoxalase/bleomycin resistance protein/dioxygenase n=1 Tax=Hymenobacter roseosalivarius DSM 11622 TaxID=645990 RepID=A0A1W1VZQ1_9BACT|nr:ring-cleaving dioxygenase [Hymenobacter roseosalivarius]SMB98839.1 Glyoxalase/bleomycin resistance protein/dioxygenase [Hymenobacter roseosalivarius DSM 11622]
MSDHILGLHHITAISSDAQRNYDFYTKVLGRRFLKKTVNFDDPSTYHFYFGDEVGSAGTILTFFPWQNMTPGRRGTGQATEIGYSVPEGSFDFWLKRFEQYNLTFNKPNEKFGEPYLTFLDPDGLKLELTVAKNPDPRTPWTTPEVSADVATKGFHNVTLTLASIKGTAEILTDVFGYKLVEQHVNRYRFATDAVPGAAIIDLVEAPGEARGHVAGGSVHHIAFRVPDDATEMRFREKIAARGLNITEQIDRQYFHSLYFREPGGILFEIATDNPGFMIDEPLAELGTHLLLPPQYEGRRAQIEAQLPVIR